MRIHDYPCPKCHGAHVMPDGRLCDEPDCGGTGFFWPDELMAEVKAILAKEKK